MDSWEYGDDDDRRRQCQRWRAKVQNCTVRGSTLHGDGDGPTTATNALSPTSEGGIMWTTRSDTTQTTTALAADDGGFCRRDAFEFAFVGTAYNGVRFQDDGLNGDDEVSTTNDVCSEQ